MQGKWTSRVFHKPAITLAPIDEAYLDKEVVVLLNNINSFGDKVYTYIQLTIRNFQAICEKIMKRQKYVPSEFGTVLAAGKGFPPEELQEEMKQSYNMQPVPPPAVTALPQGNPVVWGMEEEEEGDDSDISGNEPSPTLR